MPDTINMRRIKLDLLERLKCNDQLIGVCDEIISLDLDCADIYYRKGKAYEMLERPDGRKKDAIILIARLTHIPSNYKHALTAYEKAEHISPDELYRESIQNLLKRLGKSNQAKVYSNAGGSQSILIDQFKIVNWLFLLLPWIINSLVIMLLNLILQQPPELMIGMILATFCISAIGPLVISRKMSHTTYTIRPYCFCQALSLRLNGSL